jgi:hypothetical protein
MAAVKARVTVMVKIVCSHPMLRPIFLELAITGYSTWLAATSALAGLAKRLNRSAQSLRKTGIHAPKPIE